MKLIQHTKLKKQKKIDEDPFIPLKRQNIAGIKSVGLGGLQQETK
jgi:hypothetical protein